MQTKFKVDLYEFIYIKMIKICNWNIKYGLNSKWIKHLLFQKGGIKHFE